MPEFKLEVGIDHIAYPKVESIKNIFKPRSGSGKIRCEYKLVPIWEHSAFKQSLCLSKGRLSVVPPT